MFLAPFEPVKGVELGEIVCACKFLFGTGYDYALSLIHVFLFDFHPTLQIRQTLSIWRLQFYILV
jgi:hypothetical protein